MTCNDEEIVPFLAPTADFPAFATYDWSAEGQWLAMLLDDGTIGLLAPEQRRCGLLQRLLGNAAPRPG